MVAILPGASRTRALGNRNWLCVGAGTSCERPDMESIQANWRADLWGL